tara:strand:+ start:6639 stop:7217 length:579 start_codon:yes stop_codon:yes gene_type:complete
MADINFHPNDKVMSSLEVAKNGGNFVFGLLVFEVAFYAMYLEGSEIPALLCGIPLGLMLVAIASQCVMHFLGLGAMVMNDGNMTLRTSRSGKKRGKSIFAPLERIILAPMSRAIMRDMDKDGDGRISFDEMMEEMAGDSKEEVMEMQELFEKHDKDGDGYLSRKELEGLIRESGEEDWAETMKGNWWSEDDN